ncbi:MAG: Holliday junction branch migration protein RuvA [Bacteroidales bacterium]|nr:Holliday junction branch migration protein RuvA [Bacteroidales bacterium]MBQ9877434.1 Holliday junction branch migration protein RuvA [Bacteroidales bacterium]
MTDYVSGKIEALSPTQVVVDNHGIGYIFEISLQTFSALEGKAESTVYVQHMPNPRDGSFIDYGFATKNERELFRLITGVSGMGSASARMILSAFTSDEFNQAILSEDVNRLKSVKGLGVKSAQRLILELKDKIVKGEGEVPEQLFVATNDAMEEAARALVMLGFSKPNVNKALQNILKKDPSAKVEDLIKAALKIL